MTALNPATISAPKIPAHTCVRCNAPRDGSGFLPTCSTCATTLRNMHEAVEYTLFRKRYYTCSPEGTSLQELLERGYGRDIVLPYIPSGTQVVQVRGSMAKLPKVEDQVPKKMVPT